VVGGGSAGLVGARVAAALGASVLLVERRRLGGDCLWTGCVPSKALLPAASAAAAARSAGRYGVRTGPVQVDFTAVREHVRSAVAAIEPVDSADALRAGGVRVAAGAARLTGATTALVDDRPVVFRAALLATGSAPALPPVPGLAGAAPLTSDTVWDLDQLPGRLLVLGGGAVGCELAQAYARLGSAVTLVEALPRLLPHEDPEAGALVAAALAADGATVHTGRAVERVEPGRAVLAGGHPVVHDRILVATGRRPVTDAGLEAAGVELDRRGTVRVDRTLRTTADRVWAAGDVTGHPEYTHVAGVHGGVAATNAVFGLRRRVPSTVPRVTFTSPEVASVGLTGEQAERTDGVTARTVRHEHVDRAVAEGHTAGFARIWVDRRGRVVGGTLVGPRAGESLAELALAVRRGMRAADLVGSTHAYPTYADGLWNAAIADLMTRVTGPVPARALGVLLAGRRRWLDARSRPGAGVPGGGPG